MDWKCSAFVALLAIVSVYFTSRVLSPPLSQDAPDDIEDGWWGRVLPEVSAGRQDTSVREFRVNVSEAVLADLNYRLQNTRFVDRVEDAAFHYGSDSEYMKQVQRYWLEKYSWRDAEKRMNSVDQFITNIEGIDVHFIHAKPKLAAGQKAKPLIMSHGWPGSIHEFYKILPMLTDPESHGGSRDDVFEVICPSIPGYGFSEAPHIQGFAPYAAARVFHKLMQRLGFKEYYAQGGDWGSMITLNMAIMFPKSVKGLHTNMALQGDLLSILYPIVANLWPSVFMPNERDQLKLLNVGEMLVDFLEETGYFHIQGTKPQTVGQGLNDSPMGLAAYILEKFSLGINKDYRNLPDGGLTQKFTLDELLTNVMIYWVNGNIASAMRLYKEEVNNSKNYQRKHANMVPTGFAAFPHEATHATEATMKRFNPNLVSYTVMPRGGHFTALEEPELLAEDVRQFVRKVEAR